MFQMPIYADQALRLANERAAEYHREARLSRLARTNHGPSRFAAISAALASIRATYRSVEPASGLTVPSLTDYPSRG